MFKLECKRWEASVSRALENREGAVQGRVKIGFGSRGADRRYETGTSKNIESQERDR